MQVYLDKFAETIGPDEHVLLVLDQAGWHEAKTLRIPANITLEPLPPRSPELNPVERVWLLLEREVSLAPAARRLRGHRRRRRSRLEPGGERARTLRIPMLIPLDHELRQFINGTVSLALNLSLLSSASVSTFYLPHTRVWELLLGAWLAIRGGTRGEALRWLAPPLPRCKPTSATLAGLWLRLGDLFGSAHVVRSYVRLWKGRPLPRLARAGADRRHPACARGRFAGVAQSNCVGPSCARLRWLDQLSALSLASAAAVSHPHQRRDHTSLVIRSLAMLVAVGLAWLTYRFLERPIRRNGGDAA